MIYIVENQQMGFTSMLSNLGTNGYMVKTKTSKPINSWCCFLDRLFIKRLRNGINNHQI